MLEYAKKCSDIFVELFVIIFKFWNSFFMEQVLHMIILYTFDSISLESGLYKKEI